MDRNDKGQFAINNRLYENLLRDKKGRFISNKKTTDILLRDKHGRFKAGYTPWNKGLKKKSKV